MLADLKPWGNYTAPEMYDAGGMAVVGKRLLEAGLLSREEKTVTGRTIGEEVQARGASRRARRSSSRSPTPIKPDGRPRHPARQPGARRLRDQALRPEASTSHRGPARVFEREEDAFEAVKEGKIKPNDVIVIR